MNSKSHFTKVWQFISSSIFGNTEYAYNKETVNSRVYDITDTTELRLISSRRTFL